GEATCGLTSEQLHELVAWLEPQVAQLADILCVDVGMSQDYPQLLRSAHSQLSEVAETAAAELLAGEEAPYHRLLGESQQLAGSLRSFIEQSSPSESQPIRNDHAPSGLRPPLA